MRCHKAQKITRHTNEGKTEYTKCINLASSHFRTGVTDDICSLCPLKQMAPCTQGCNKKRRPNLPFSEPTLKEGFLIYTEDNAPIPPGFEETESGVKSMWPGCPGIITANTINDDGSLKVVIKCDFKKKEVSFEECSNCFKELEKEPKPEPTMEPVMEPVMEPIIEPASIQGCSGCPGEIEAPALPTQIKHYGKALYNWVKEGREVRTDEEVIELLTICKSCSNYDAHKQICKKCGCRVNSGGRAISNKLKMKSEKCPIGKW